MNTPNEPTTHAARFMKQLRALKEDRGRMAALRRGLSPATARESWPVLGAMGQDIGRLAPRTVAALFAKHPEDDPQSYSLGAACRRIAMKEADAGKMPESFERRFRRLLACDSAEDVAGQLSTWIRFASSKGVAVNYEQIFWDLEGWEKRSDAIKLQWARDFWPARREAEETSQPEEAAA